jgi:hypothetical protein
VNVGTRLPDDALPTTSEAVPSIPGELEQRVREREAEDLLRGLLE